MKDQAIYHYASADGRELLSAAFAPTRSKKGSLQGRSFRVTATVSADRYSNEYFEQLLPVKLKIQTGGGFYSSVRNKQYEIVDLLLYSPFAGRHEIIRATLDKESEYCFSDIRLYRQFVSQYGNPGIPLLFGSLDSNNGNDWNLRAESILKQFGYSVAKSDHLSAAKRQSILSEVIDLEILDIPKIISYLDFFCNSHHADKYSLNRLRWLEDRKFVENYKSNPERFLIAQPKARNSRKS